jgi:hypothetical protein
MGSVCKLVVFGIGLFSIASGVEQQQAWALGKAKHSGEVIQNSLTVESVKLSRQNKLAGDWGCRVSCTDSFTGSHAGNTLTIRAHASGGDGQYKHSLVYNFGDSYQLNQKELGQHEKTIRGNGTFKIKLPLLKDTIPFVQQSFLLVTQDKSGNLSKNQVIIRVSRPVIFRPSEDQDASCFERYQPYESLVGTLSNGSTALSRIEIKREDEKSWSCTKGNQVGVFFNPTVGAYGFLASIFSLNYNHFSETARQLIERSDVSQSYELNPGDYMQVYVQPTRYITAYDADLVGPCGETKELKGAYYYQWWGFAYHVYPIDPLSSERALMDAIGAPIINTCSDKKDHPGADQSGQYPFHAVHSQAGKL